MSGQVQEEPIAEFEDEDEDDTEEHELDLLEQMFLNSGPEAELIIHFGDCVAQVRGEQWCTCERLRLQRGAKA